MGSLFNIAAVFWLVKLNFFTFAALKNKCAGAVIIMFLLCWMNAIFSYIAFYIHFDTHLTECRLHRHHGDDCQVHCILKEMASGQGLSEQVIALAYAFPVFLFQKKTIVSPCTANRNFEGILQASIPPGRHSFGIFG